MKKYALFLLLISAVMLACNLVQRVPASSLQPTPTSAGLRATPQQLPPSITPLFGGAPAAATQPPVGGQTAPLGAQTDTTPAPGVQIFVTPGATPLQTPGTVTVTIPTGQIGDFITYMFDNILIPILNIGVNFIAQSVGYLWQLAGVQGGWVGQVGCCLVPAFVLVIYVLRGGRFRRRWRR
jgi:hypothetical protein